MVVVSVVYFVAVIVLAHFFAPPGYHWTQNTVSELAAQGHRHKWIMQAGFIGFGALLNAGILVKFAATGKVNYPDVLLMVYGVAILLSGIFCAAPADESISHSVREAGLHSFFASVAGVSFSLAVLWHLLVSSGGNERMFHAGFLVAIVGSSMLFGLSENGVVGIGQGVVQRILYLVSFVWLIAQGYWRPG